ncbi:MAG: ABC transporter permease/substrate-binding protein, partial [Planctomycetota bacterium]|nr:ABC transporter permease/substrate-binding protein [Planctomycetota bacterium]
MDDVVAQRFDECLRNLPSYLGQHVLISALALGIGIAVSLPLAILGARSKTLRWPTLTAASIIQTIPSMALLALFYPVLVVVRWLVTSGIEAVTGEPAEPPFSALGFFPTVIALTLYSMLPILRNTVTAITGVDPAMTEAARGLGMRPRQVLLKVELPLASPVIIAGIRTATVWVVGIATLSTPVGQTSLGNYIFTGLQTLNWISVLFGCVCAAALAIVLDQLIGLAQSAATRRSPGRALAAGLGLVAVIVGGLAPVVYRPEADYAIGAKTFTEQFVLASVVRGQLSDRGLDAEVREGLGSSVIFDALGAGEVDCYVDYSGTIWVNHMKRKDMADRETVLREMTGWLEREHGIRCLGPLGFENAYCLAMRRERAEARGARAIGDLTRASPDLTIGGSYEFFGRPEWQQMKRAYGLRFQERKQYQSTFMYKAIQDGDVDVIAAFSSDGRIAAYDLVVLDDPKRVIPPYDAVLLVAPGRADDQALVEALRPLLGKVPVEAMRRANHMVDRETNKATVDQAADWLRREIGLTQPV